jgi:hypothetical protein
MALNTIVAFHFPFEREPNSLQLLLSLKQPADITNVVRIPQLEF